MRWLRLLYKLPTVILVTGVCAAVPGVAGLLAGRRRPWVMRLGTAACGAWGRALCAILTIERDVAGPVPSGGVFLVAANHLSYLDILVLASLYPSTFVAKREIAGWPVFGWLARGAGTLFVDRETPKDVMRAGREMSERLRSGISLTIFPEGRSSPGESVLPFQPALLEPAAKAAVPCIAVSITYETPGSDMPPSRTVCWYDSENFVTHFRRLAGLKRVVARVRFTGPPVVSYDRKALARALWERTAATFEPIRQA